MGDDSSSLHLVVITGMSGAGRSTALKALEDLGYFCVDNIPPALIQRLIGLLGDDRELTHLGLGIDVRTGGFLAGAEEIIDDLTKSGLQTEIIFLESNEETLIRRFSETRRTHPLEKDGNLLQAIQRERDRLAPLRTRANHTIDTSGLSVHDLRRNIVSYIASGSRLSRMVTRIVSFGYKYGLPLNADLVFDLRYLPNPHFVPELKPLSGLDRQVSEFVLQSQETQELLRDLESMLLRMLPRYEREGKAYLTVCLGCTGGRHRSVAMAENLAGKLREKHKVVVEHRDIEGRR
ncbi:MAG: RNase adapter RapZ [Deltaproteobacteria bacterium]|nr:RNase adapter RapZ [Deltaproteobacteria bacterium]